MEATGRGVQGVSDEIGNETPDSRVDYWAVLTAATTATKGTNVRERIWMYVCVLASRRYKTNTTARKVKAPHHSKSKSVRETEHKPVQRAVY